jgi:hypothetical protein
MKFGVFLFVLLFLVPERPLQAAEPIQLDSRNPHYFSYKGKTIALIGSGEHYGAVINADFDFHKYLATIQRDGMNYTRLFAGSYVEVPKL